MSKTENYKGYTITIENDSHSESPREWDNLGTLVCNHRRYDLGDKNHNIRLNDFNSWEELKKHIQKEKDIALILPVYMMDHSGLSFSTKDFGCPWDSGQVGFIFIEKEKVRTEFNVKRITSKLLSQIQASLESEINTYNDYVNGNVYYYDIQDPSGESIDSCSGCYDYDDVLFQAKTLIDKEAA